MTEGIRSSPDGICGEEEAVIRHYNQTDYSDFWAGGGKYLLDEWEKKLIQCLVPNEPGWFIDIGCGYGRLLSTYAYPNRRIVLLDCALNLLQEASQRYPQDSIHFIAADVYQLPFRDHVFAGGLCVRLFHHINAPRLFLDEISRVFCRGGKVVCSYSNKRNILRLLKRGTKALKRDHEPYGAMVFGTHPGYFAQLCREAAFRTECTRGTGFFDQLFRLSKSTDRVLRNRPMLGRGISAIEAVADGTLGRMNLAPLNFALLSREGGPGTSAAPVNSPPQLNDILACPCCRRPDLSEGSEGYTCVACGRVYPKRGRIIDFRVDGQRA